MSGDCGSIQFTSIEGFRTRRTPTTSVPCQEPLYRNLRVTQESHLEGSQSWEASAQDVILTAIERRQMPPRPGGILPLTGASGPNWICVFICLSQEQDRTLVLAWFWLALPYSFQAELGIRKEKRRAVRSESCQ